MLSSRVKYNCQLCGNQTSQKTQLKLHELAGHDGNIFQCTECEFHATQKSRLVKHHQAILKSKDIH
jgi:hypothetical protein